jgi:hypothetical protein
LKRPSHIDSHSFRSPKRILAVSDGWPTVLSPSRDQDRPEYLGNAAKYLGNAAKYLGSVAKYLGNAAKYLGNAAKYLGNAAKYLYGQQLEASRPSRVVETKGGVQRNPGEPASQPPEAVMAPPDASSNADLSAFA